VVSSLLLIAMLFQGSPQAAPKPVLDNDRIVVYDVSAPIAAQPMDAVVVSLKGTAVFVPKGVKPKIDGRSMVIDLKDVKVAPIANRSGYPLGYPRPGAKKLFENDRVIVWDNVWAPGVPTPMHFHDKDTVVVFLTDGQVKSTTLDGKAVVGSNSFGLVRFSPRDRTHTEELVSGKARAIITELK